MNETEGRSNPKAVRTAAGRNGGDLRDVNSNVHLKGQRRNGLERQRTGQNIGNGEYAN